MMNSAYFGFHQQIFVPAFPHLITYHIPPAQGKPSEAWRWGWGLGGVEHKDREWFGQDNHSTWHQTFNQSMLIWRRDGEQAHCNHFLHLKATQKHNIRCGCDLSTPSSSKLFNSFKQIVAFITSHHITKVTYFKVGRVGSKDQSCQVHFMIDWGCHYFGWEI